MSHSVVTDYLYFCVGMYITTYFHTLTHVLDRCLAYIRDGTIALRMYVTVVSPYPWNRGAIGSFVILIGAFTKESTTYMECWFVKQKSKSKQHKHTDLMRFEASPTSSGNRR